MKKVFLIFALFAGFQDVVAGPALSKNVTPAVEKALGVVLVVGAVTVIMVLHQQSIENRRKRFLREFWNSQNQSITIKTKVPFFQNNLDATK
jgi:hypothetical protein